MRRSHIAQAILAYLYKNPHAQDTLAGIAQWWLPQQSIKTSEANLSEVLDELVAKGLILQSKGKDRQIHYRINNLKLKEIAKLL